MILKVSCIQSFSSESLIVTRCPPNLLALASASSHVGPSTIKYAEFPLRMKFDSEIENSGAYPDT